MAHTPENPACTTRHAVILAAGESKRTRPLTLHRPKPLIPLLDRPLLAHILDQLLGLVERITLVVGYRAEAIQAAFGANYHGIALEYVLQQEMNGTAGALLAVADHAAAQGQPVPDEPFFLLYGDNLVSQRDILGVCQQRYCVAALRVADPSAFGVLDIVDGQVQRIIEKPTSAPPEALANPGIYHFDGAVYRALRQIRPSPRGEYELTDLIALLASQEQVGYHVCEGYWIPVGTPWDVLVASQFLLEQASYRRSYINPQASLADDCDLSGMVRIGRASIGTRCRIRGPVFLADDVVVGDGCTLDRAVLLPGAVVGAGSTIEQSVLGKDSRTGDMCIIQGSVLDDEAITGVRSTLRARVFEDVRPVADTGGLLDVRTMQWRGAVLGRGVVARGGRSLEAGSIVFPEAAETPTPPA